MTLHRKAILVVLLTTITVAVMAVVVAKAVLMPGLLAYEQHSIQERLETLSATLERVVMDLDRTANDYSAWNRTYNFMQHPDPDYERVEVNDQSFEKYDIQVVMLIGLDDRLVLEKTFKSESDAAVKQADVAAIRAATHDFLGTIRNEVSIRGIVAAPDATFAVVMRPILKTNGIGPARGMLVMAKRIDSNELEFARQVVHAGIDILRGPGAERSRDDANVTVAVGGTQAWFVRRPAEVVGYLRLVDVRGGPAGVLRLTTDRTLYARSRRHIWLSAALVAATAVLLGLGTLWFLHAVILSRMRRALKAVKQITAENDLSIRVAIRRDDELGQLARALNQMLDELERSRNELLAIHAAVKFEATHDVLTGLKNRRAILAALKVEATRANREGTKLGVLLADIDHFKQINDCYGHSAGDAVLASVASALESELRPYDAAGRYGGEEFLMVIPGVNHVRAMTVAERLRHKVEKTVRVQAPGGHRVTVSIGVAVTDGDEPLESVIESADASMYAAKSAGRNCVEMKTTRPELVSRSGLSLREYSGA